MKSFFRKKQSRGESSILVVISNYPPSFTGAGLRAHRQIKELKNRYNTSVEVLTLGASPNHKSRLFENVKIHEVFLKSSKLKKNYVNQTLVVIELIFHLLCFFYRQPNFQVVHGFSSGWLVFVSLIVGKFNGCSTIFEQTLMNADDAISISKKGRIQYLIFGWIKLWLLKKMVDLFVCISDELRKSNLSVGINSDKIWVRDNPVNPDVFFPPASFDEKRIIRTYLGLPREGAILLNVGRICPRKNQLFILESLSYLDIDMDVTCVLVGPKQSENEDYFKKVESSNTGKVNLVICPENRHDIDQFMKAADLFVFASISEGFGNVLLEALMAGIPVVMLELKSISQRLVWESLCGDVVTPATTKEFADKVKSRLIQAWNPASSFLLHQKVKQRFDYSETIKQYHDYYKSFCSKWIDDNYIP